MTKGALVGKQYTLTVQRRPFNISASSAGWDAWRRGFSELKVREGKWLKGVDNSFLCNLLSLLMKMISVEVTALCYTIPQCISNYI